MSEPAFRCLSIRQPWAWAIMSGGKDIENRTWQTDYRGPIAIHAGAAKTVVNRFIDSGGPALSAMEFSYGSLIGIVDLVDVVPLSQELETNPWAWGPYCWRVANPRPFREPIPAKGKLRLYTLPATMSPRLSAEIDSARDSHPHASATAWIEITSRPEATDVRSEGLFDSYLALSDVPNLMRLAEDAIAQRGDSAAFVYRAIARCLDEDNDAALADANQAIALDPRSARAFLIRSRIYTALHEPKLASLDRRTAEELAKGTPASNSEEDDIDQ